MKYERSKVYFEEKEDIGYLIINDPPANKMTDTFMHELSQLVKEHISKTKVKGIIITGAGRHYSSGVVVDRIKDLVVEEATYDEEGRILTYPKSHQADRASFSFFYGLKIPVISAINGFCIGSGLELALCSHIRICGNNTTMGHLESTFGFLPALSGTLRSLELCGLGRAMELVLSGQTFTAQEAKQFGIADLVVNKKQTLAYSESLMNYLIHHVSNYNKDNTEEYIQHHNMECWKDLE